LNARRFLHERLQSISQQSLYDREVIACDSFSDDGTWEYIQKHAVSPRFRMFQVPRHGLYAGWNETLTRARGKYIHIATADDTIEPTFLEKAVAALEKCPSAHVAACRYRTIDEDGREVTTPPSDVEVLLAPWLPCPHVRHGLTEFIIQLGVGCNWGTFSAVVFRRELLDRVGLFRTDIGVEADTVWRLEAMLRTDLVQLPEYLATWRVHARQATSRRPPGWNLQHFRCQREALDRCARILPAPWRQDPLWRRKLLFHPRQVYLGSYGLNRNALKHCNREILRRWARALRHEPAYVLKRLMTGFTWKDPIYSDSIEVTLQLIREWNVPWPPITLKS
jgi:glycosyltransferase involved in cell wall biosynthesis